MVSSTSPKRRSTIHSRIAIEISAQAPASKKARTIGVAGFEDRDRPAGRVRLDRQHGAREIAQRLVVVRIALRQHLDARAAVRRQPVLDDIGAAAWRA